MFRVFYAIESIEDNTLDGGEGIGIQGSAPLVAGNTVANFGRGMVTEATVKVKVGDELLHTAAEGNGPVNALDQALRKALLPVFPKLENFQLVDYKVRILDGGNATAATTRVLVDTQNGTSKWSTVGASTNIIEASWLALADSIEYGLLVDGRG